MSFSAGKKEGGGGSPFSIQNGYAKDDGDCMDKSPVGQGYSRGNLGKTDKKKSWTLSKLLNYSHRRNKESSFLMGMVRL